MPNSTVPANATALPFELASTPTRIFAPYLDFAADDSGAMAHVFTDEKGTHVMRTLGGEPDLGLHNFVPFKNRDLTGESMCRTAQRAVADDPHEAFLVALKALIAAPWPVAVTI